MKENWTYKKLGEVASFVKDGDWIESRYQSENGLRLIQTGNVGNGSFKAKEDKPHYISEKTFTELGCTEIYSGDCLVSRLPEPIGRACIIPNVNYRMITAVDCTIIRFKDIMNPHFFVYYTKSKEYEREINNHTTGTTRKRISRKNLESVCIPVPPIEIQHRIVSELDLLQSVIDKQQAQLKELDTLAQAVFYDMFGDPVENEKGFDVKELGEICNVVSGFAFPSGDFSDNNPIKAIKITNVGVGEFLLDNSSLPEKYRNLTAYMANTGDIAIALTRTIISTGLKRAIVSEEYNNSLVNQRVAILKCSSYVKTLIYCYLGTDYVKNYVLEHATALLQPNLSITDLRKMPIVFPPLSLQQEFAEKIEKIEKQKTAIAQSIAETQKLFNYTMDKYFG